MTHENQTKDDSLVTNDIIDLLKKQLTIEKVKDFTINISAGSVKGDNYLGIIAKATVNGTDKDGKAIETSYIIKSAPKAEGFRNLAPIRMAYEREIYMYNTVLPAFMKFQEQKKVKEPFNSIAKCLQTSLVDKDEAIIMEDMKTKGYIMQNRRLPLNYNHVKLVIQQLAKLHAFSFVMKDQEPEWYHQLSDRLKRNFFDEMDKEQFTKHADLIYDKARGGMDPVQDEEALKRFNKYAETINNDMYVLMSPDEAGEHAIIRHADCWTNNFLFYYENEDHKTPAKVCFLDWQIVCLGSPVLDLLYFIYACTDKKLLDEHFDSLLQYYHNEMKTFGAELGSDIDKLFPYETLMEHMKKFGRYGLAMATMLIHLMISESDEVPNMNEIFEDGSDNMVEAFTYESKNEAYYHKRIRDVILHQVEKDYI